MVDHIERELVLPASTEEVWEVVTTSGWLADEVQLDLRPGGDAFFHSEEWVKTGWVEEAVAPGEEAVAPGEEADAPGEEADAPGEEDLHGARLVFWWSQDGEPASRVELTLEPEDATATRVRVVEARPLEVLDVAGIPLPGSRGQSHGPAMLVAA